MKTNQTPKNNRKVVYTKHKIVSEKKIICFSLTRTLESEDYKKKLWINKPETQTNKTGNANTNIIGDTVVSVKKSMWAQP